MHYERIIDCQKIHFKIGDQRNANKIHPCGMGNVAQPLTQKTGREQDGTQDPSPQIDFPMENQACIVPRLL